MHRLGDRVAVERVDEEARLRRHELGRAADARRHDRAAAGHSLEQRLAERLEQARLADDVAAGEVARDLVVAHGTGDRDPARAGGIYERGWLRLRRRTRQAARPLEAACFAAGLGLIFVALCSPIGTFDQQLFSLHMTEHLLLTLGAAPLLLLGRPLVPLLWGMPEQERRGAARLLARHTPVARAGQTLANPRLALPVFVTIFAIWHVPALYDAAQGQTTLHYAEHTLFVVSALLFWCSALTT